MLNILFDNELEQQLQALAQNTGKTQEYYVVQAVREFLEDKQDYLAGLTVLEKNNPRYSLEKTRAKLGLDT